MITFGNDVADFILQQTLQNNTLGLSETINRMTSGYKINSAKDNAATISIINDLSTKISSMLQVQQNTEDGIDMLQTAQGGLETIQELLSRLKELTTQASNDTYDERSRNAMQTEANAIIDQISRIKNSIEYNGKNLYETPREDSTTSIANKAIQKLANSAKVTNTGNNAYNTISESFIPNSVLDSEAAAEERTSATAFSLDSARAGANTIEGSVDFNGSETKTITIDDVSYTVKNKLSNGQTLSYSKDKDTGVLTFLCSSFTIQGDLDISHNILIKGQSNSVYGGNLADKIITNSGATSNYIYGLGGDDELIGRGSSTYIYGGNGNDIINVESYCSVYGEDGDDIINVKSSCGTIRGGVGNDTFNISSSGSEAKFFGDTGDDIFNINTSNNVFIDGGTGTNSMNGTLSSSSTAINVIGANANSIDLKANVAQTVNINGINYTISSTSNATFVYKILSNGQIDMSSPINGITIRGENNKAHNVRLSSGITFYGGDLADTIELNWHYCTVYGLGGNDTITSNGFGLSKIFGGSGDDIINLGTYGRNYVVGGNGNDTITSGAYSKVFGGDGDDKISILGNGSSIIGGAGNNTLVKDTGNNTFINGFGSIDNATCIDLAANETKKINIDGKEYTVKNRLAYENALIYSLNDVTGEITFDITNIDITGQKDVAHNVILTGGYSGSFRAGDLDDKIVVKSAYGTIYAGAGNDTIIANGAGNSIYGEDGDDNITQETANTIYGGNGNDVFTIKAGGTVDGGNGDDTFYINATATIKDTGGNNIYYVNTNNATISGAEGDDTFYITGNGNTINGMAGNNYYIIDGNNNQINGGNDENYFVDNSYGNSYISAIQDPNGGRLHFTSKDEIKIFTLNGKTYSVENMLSGENEISYSLNKNTGTITINGSNFQIDAVANESAILNIRGDNNIVNGSNLADRITIEKGSNNTINGLDGDDILTTESDNNSLNGGNGNDTLNLNASSNLDITGGSGNDTININSDSNTKINAGIGNNTLNVSGSNNIVKADNGNNRILASGNENTITTKNGDNKYTITGSGNSVTTESGKNTVGIQGNDNNFTAQNVDGKINIYGDNNTFTNTNGGNTVLIRGNKNTFTTVNGKKDITVKGNNNIINGSRDANNIKISGNSNNTNGGADIDSFLISSGSNNIIDGKEGRNTLIDNGQKTTFTNAVDITPRPFEVKIKVDMGSGDDKYISSSISFNLFDFSVDLTSAENALESLSKIDEMMQSANEQLVNIGTLINRLQTVAQAQAVKLENLTSSCSTLRDADIADESSKFIKYQILQQASATLISSSRNLHAQNILGLLQNL